MRRATNAEQQLETLQATLAKQLGRYQQEIMRLRTQLRTADGAAASRAAPPAPEAPLLGASEEAPGPA